MIMHNNTYFILYFPRQTTKYQGFWITSFHKKKKNVVIINDHYEYNNMINCFYKILIILDIVTDRLNRY